jgi:carbonic anhydrase
MKLSLGSSCLAAIADAWTYTNFDAWPTEAPLCDSTVPNQSPIDISTVNPGTCDDPLVFQGLPDSAVTPEIRGELVINNHTWEIEWDVDGAAETQYGVQYNEKVYALKQFHFHSPSEHTIDGQHFDFEAHLVHACLGNISCTTVDENDENLVVAIFMNVGDENPYLASVWPAFQAYAADDSATNIVADLANPYERLVPAGYKDFYRYVGSTTTPTCVTNVEWFLMASPVTISQAQLTAYRTAISNNPNTQTVVVSEAPAGVTEGWDVTLGNNNRQIQVIGADRVAQKYIDPREVAEQQTSFMWEGIIIFIAVVTVAVCCLLVYTQVLKKDDKKPKPKPPTKRGVTPKPPPTQETAPLLQAPPLLIQQPLQVPMTTIQPQMMQPQLVQMPQMAVQQTMVGGVRMVAP